MAQSATTPFRPDTADELPVGVQLGWRLRALIAAGRLQPGERMPSVRTMADWAQVNVNTVRAVYARLEHEGLIVTRHGRGSFVAEGARGSPEVERIAAEAIAAARVAEVDPRDVAIAALVAIGLPDAPEGDLPPEPETPELDLAGLALELELDDSWLDADEGAARRELRRQIGRLEAELAAYSRDEPPRPRRCSIRTSRGSPGSPSSRPSATPCFSASPRPARRRRPGPRASAARVRSATRWSPTPAATAGRWSRRPRPANRAARAGVWDRGSGRSAR